MLKPTNLSDKAVKAALDEYDNAIGANVGEAYAMRLAIETAMSIESKRFKSPGAPQDQTYEDFGIVLITVAVCALVIGMVARWLA